MWEGVLIWKEDPQNQHDTSGASAKGTRGSWTITWFRRSVHIKYGTSKKEANVTRSAPTCQPKRASYSNNTTATIRPRISLSGRIVRASLLRVDPACGPTRFEDILRDLRLSSQMQCAASGPPSRLDWLLLLLLLLLLVLLLLLLLWLLLWLLLLLLSLLSLMPAAPYAYVFLVKHAWCYASHGVGWGGLGSSFYISNEK